MKKFLSLIILLCMIISAVPVAAQPENSEKMQELLLLVKERIGSTDAYDKMDSSSSTDSSGRTSYRFTWYSENPDLGELSVTVTESGIITRYYNYHYNDYSYAPTVNKPTSDEILPIAKQFAEKLNPQISSKLEVSNGREYESLTADSFDFAIQRVENGLPVINDTGRLSVSSDGQKLISFNLSFTEGLSFENTDKLIVPSDAKSAYTEKAGFKLYYYDETKDGVKYAFPVYVPDWEYDEYISAVSGEIVTPVYPQSDDYYYRLNDVMKEESAVADSAAGESGLSAAEISEISATRELLSFEKVLEIVRANAFLNIDETYSVKSSELNKTKSEPAQYTYSIRLQNEQGYTYINVDAKTGEIKFFRKNGTYSENPVITGEQAKSTAVSAASALAAKHFPQDGKSPYILDETHENDYSYKWVRHVNDVPYTANTISVEIDSVTGDVIYYRIYFDDIEFESLEDILTVSEISEKYFEYNECYPAYIKTCSNEGLAYFDKAIAVYMTDRTHDALRAKTGESLYNSRSNTIPPYTDVNGHYGENAINTLRKFGVGFAQENFRPDDVITIGDFTTLLDAIFVTYNPVCINENYVNTNAYSRVTGIRNVNPEDLKKPLTREDAAKLIIKAMNLEEIATLEGIYTCPFADVTSSVGHISILSAMGLFRGDLSGNFNPSRTLTRADAAIVLYNYLSR